MRQVNSEYGPRWYESPDGARFPGVTSILGVINKPALVNWAANRERALVVDAAADLYEDLPPGGPGGKKMSRAGYVTTLTSRLPTSKAHRMELEKAGEIGSRVHALIEWNLRKELGQAVGPQPVLKDEALFAFSAYEQWRASVHLRPVFIEQQVWSRECGYAGTLDLFAELTLPEHGKVLAVLDWKTGKAIYAEALLQNAAYVNALVEMGHAKGAPWGVVCRFPKTITDPGFDVRVIRPEERAEHFRVFLHALELFKWQQAESAPAPAVLPTKAPDKPRAASNAFDFAA